MSVLRFLLVVFCSIILVGCESEKRFPAKGYIPTTPESTDVLKAQYFWIPQNTIHAAYWSDASFREVELHDVETRNLYSDGVLNATGTYSGTESFNMGNAPQMLVKAGYDQDYIYLLLEWKDTTANADYFTWKWDGDKDPLKTDSTNGWTSQNNNDNISLLFKKEGGGYEVWKWSLAYTAPFNMALQTVANEQMQVEQAENLPYSRNSNGQTARSGPMYEWNDIRQDITVHDNTAQILDASKYLLDEYKTEFKGDVAAGQIVFNKTADCRFCHGPNGNGVPDDYTDGGALNQSFINKYTREGLTDYVSSSAHEGSGSQYWGRIKNNPEAIENLNAFIRANAGIPGHVLKQPEDITVSCLSNITVGGIETKNTSYRLLFKRKLHTDKTNDIDFDSGQTYMLSIQVSDNDEINFIGSDEFELNFDSNEL